MVGPGLPTPRILSIQSTVVHGYVGNKCAVAPLNRLGLEVDAINSVQFCNHTGYPSFAGQVLDGADLLTLVDGLEGNGLLRGYTHLLTGYIGSLSLLETIAGVVQRLRAANPDLVYVCDPVQGDHGRLYCKPELPVAYRDTIVPLASVLTPNQFEAELLTGRSIASEADAAAACAALHARGPHTVVLTSLDLPSAPDHVTIVASTTLPQGSAPAAPAAPTVLKLSVPRVREYFTGTGDLFSALLLAWLHRYPGNLGAALEAAVAGLQAVLADTVAASRGVAGQDERTAAVCAARELRLVPNLDRLAEPTVVHRAVPLAVGASLEVNVVGTNKGLLADLSTIFKEQGIAPVADSTDPFDEPKVKDGFDKFQDEFLVKLDTKGALVVHAVEEAEEVYEEEEGGGGEEKEITTKRKREEGYEMKRGGDVGGTGGEMYD